MATQTPHAPAEDGFERVRGGLVLLIAASALGDLLAMWAGRSLLAAALTALLLTAVLMLGAWRPRGGGPLRIWYALALVAWLICFAAMHWLPADTQRLVLGLPPATAAALLGLWLAPLLLVTLPYVLHFNTAVLDAADLAALEAAAAPESAARAETRP